VTRKLTKLAVERQHQR